MTRAAAEAEAFRLFAKHFADEFPPLTRAESARRRWWCMGPTYRERLIQAVCDGKAAEFFEPCAGRRSK